MFYGINNDEDIDDDMQMNGNNDKIITQENYINPKGVVHITAGGAGCDEYKKPGQHSLPPFLAKRVDELSTGVLTVYNSTTLHFDLIRSSDMQVVDEFTLVKGEIL